MAYSPTVPLASVAVTIPARPSLPLSLALDAAMADLASGAGKEPLLLVDPTVAHAEAVRARWWGTVVAVLDTSPSPDDESLVASIMSFGITVVSWEELPSDRRMSLAVWIEPSETGLESAAGAVARAMAEGGLLAVVGSGPLDRFRAGLAPGRRSAPGRTANATSVARLLGWPAVTRHPFYGLRSVGWALARLVAERAGQPHLADRFEAAFRLALPEAQGSRLWSIGSVVVRWGSRT